MNPNQKPAPASSFFQDLLDRSKIPGQTGFETGMTTAQLKDQADAPLFIAPGENNENLRSTEISDIEAQPSDKQNLLPKNYNQLAEQEPVDMENQAAIDAAIATPGVVESGKLEEGNQFGLPASPAQPETPKDKYEQLIAEYRKTREQGDADITEARKTDRNMKLMNAVLGSLGGIANAQSQKRNAIVGVGVQSPDLSKVSEMWQSAPNAQADAARKLEALKEQYSMLSKGDQDKLKEKFLEVAQENALTNRLRAQNTGVNNPAEARRKEQFEYTKIKNMQEAFNKDKIVQKAEERINSAMTLKEMAISNNPISQEAAKTFAARASGEVGALSDGDKASFGGTQAILGRIDQSYQQMLDGNLSKENKKFMADLADGFERAGKRDLKNRLSVFAKQASKRTEGTTEQQAAEIIRPDLTMESELSNEKVDVISPDGKEGKIPKRQLDAAIKKGYKLK